MQNLNNYITDAHIGNGEFNTAEKSFWDHIQARLTGVNFQRTGVRCQKTEDRKQRIEGR